jgi:hypothetical protein
MHSSLKKDSFERFDRDQDKLTHAIDKSQKRPSKPNTNARFTPAKLNLIGRL